MLVQSDADPVTGTFEIERECAGGSDLFSKDQRTAAAFHLSASIGGHAAVEGDLGTIDVADLRSRDDSESLRIRLRPDVARCCW
jgi:hypothetical protein